MNARDLINKYLELKKTLPVHPTFSSGLEDSEYVSHSHRLKSCYFCFDCVDCQNCLYCFDCVRSNDCLDCDYVVECELLYESNDSYQSYNSICLDYCARLYDSYFCWDCSDSHNLFGCVHLKQKQYCIFNKQYSKADYFREIKNLLKQPDSVHRQKLKDLSNKYPFGPTYVSHSENSDFGNQVHYSNNCYMCFDAARSENCAYMYDSYYSKNSFDLTYCYKAELSYECIDSAKIYNCVYVDESVDCFDSSYLYYCKDCHNCFGCVGLAHKRYCILNKQYTKEDYEKLISEFKSAVH